MSEKSPCQPRACLSAPRRGEINLISRVKGLWLGPAPQLLSKLGSRKLPPEVSVPWTMLITTDAERGLAFLPTRTVGNSGASLIA